MSRPTDLLVLESRPQAPDEVLSYYDGPVLMWLHARDGRQFLATALPEDGGEWPFLLLDVSDAWRERLEAGHATLREAYTARGAMLYLLPDYGAEDLEIEELDELPEHWLPADEYLE